MTALVESTYFGWGGNSGFKEETKEAINASKKNMNVFHSFADLKPGCMAISIPGQDFSSVSTHTAAGSRTKAALTVPWRHKIVLISSKDTS